MVKQIYKYMAVLLLAGMVIGCSPEALDNVPLTESDVPIQLSGAVTRALGDTDDPGDGLLIETGYPLEAYEAEGVKFYLSARTTDATPANYFLNQEITIGGQNPTDEGRNELDGTVYYPLGQKAINLYAHTGGNAQANGNITLNAGTGLANDYLLGTGTEADGATSKLGKSDDPIKYITFKHLMTRVDVKIEVDETVQATKPTSISMQFYRSGNNAPIANRGTYNIFSGGNATNNPTGMYGFSNITTTARTYYLVPNGTNLTTYSGRIFNSLTIDQYTASSDDLLALDQLGFPQTNQGKDFVLEPGLAYELTFKINRLKIVDIQLTLKDWDPKPGNTEWDYEPKTITLEQGTGSDYVFNEANKITQMVLKYESGGSVYQYIGAGSWESGTNRIDFVTLPANLSDGTLTADLYTDAGLLVDGVSIESSGTSSLQVLDLGQYGMKKNEDILEISTPLQFTLMLNDGLKLGNQKYSITKTIDMGGVNMAVTPNNFPLGSVLDGGGNEILNLEVDGNGLFNQNLGTLKNFRIVSGIIRGTSGDYIGSVCATNAGIIEAVVNQADIQPATGQLYAGGIAGSNNSGTIVASVNSGNILNGTRVGGIVGHNLNTDEGAITACLNVGQLYKGAEHLAGIIGYSDAATSGPIVKSSFWLTGTARKNQEVSDEQAIGNNLANGVDEISADLAESTIRNDAIFLLNSALYAALKSWEFVMEQTKSSWPIPVLNP